MRNIRPSTHGLLREAKPVSFSNNKLEIGFGGEGFGFHRAAISEGHNKALVEKIVSEYFNKNISIDFTMDDTQVEEENTEEDTIQEVIDFFGEDIVEIKKSKGRRINMARGGFPGGMGGNMGNMMKQMKKVQKQMEEMQSQLEETEVEASAGGEEQLL